MANTAHMEPYAQSAQVKTIQMMTVKKIHTVPTVQDHILHSQENVQNG